MDFKGSRIQGRGHVRGHCRNQAENHSWHSQNSGSRNSRKERFRNTVYEKLVTKYHDRLEGRGADSKNEQNKSKLNLSICHYFKEQ